MARGRQMARGQQMARGSKWRHAVRCASGGGIVRGAKTETPHAPLITHSDLERTVWSHLKHLCLATLGLLLAASIGIWPSSPGQQHFDQASGPRWMK